MKIDLETDEILNIVIDGTCEFQVMGYRNEEGTMVLETKRNVEDKTAQ